MAFAMALICISCLNRLDEAPILLERGKVHGHAFLDGRRAGFKQSKMNQPMPEYGELLHQAEERWDAMLNKSAELVRKLRRTHREEHVTRESWTDAYIDGYGAGFANPNPSP